ncbi:unnamed protein product, partial [Allacma fusca]
CQIATLQTRINYLCAETYLMGGILRRTIVNPPNHKNESGEDQASKSVKIPTIPIPDDEFVKSLYQCLSERGVLREVHSLLRQRLVEILKGSYPTVVTSGCTSNFNPVVVKLLEDCLCCHNCLFTYSVFVAEVDGKPEESRDFGKLPSFEAEKLLHEVGILENNSLSLKILKQYSDSPLSLLECIIDTSCLPANDKSARLKPCRDIDTIFDEPLSPPGGSSKRIKFIDNEFAERSNQKFADTKLESVDEKYFHLQLSMERDKEAQLKIAMQRFREEEKEKIRDEVETRLKFEFLAKEKELLRNYDDRVAHMKTLLDREKEVWVNEKTRKEKELISQRQDLVRLMEHVKEKKLKLKEALQRAAHTNQFESVGSERSEKKKMGSSEDVTDTSSESDRKIRLMKDIQLESAVRRLQEENFRLHKKILKQPHGSSRLTEKFSNISTDDDSSDLQYRKSTRKTDVDKVALLQYTVEKQAEELESLKLQLNTKKGLLKFPLPLPTTRLPHKPSADSPFLQDTSLEAFLAESKIRFAEIEKKADVMTSSLKEVFKRSNVSSRRNYSDSSHAAASPTCKPPSLPKLPSNLNQQKGIPDNICTSSKQARVRVTKFAATTGGLESSLKYFLLNQNEDIFTSGIEIPKSAHTKLLTDPKVLVFPEPNTKETSKPPVQIITKDTSKGVGGIVGSTNSTIADKTNIISAEVESLRDEKINENKTQALSANNSNSMDSFIKHGETPKLLLRSPANPTTEALHNLRDNFQMQSVKEQENESLNKSNGPPMRELEAKLAEIVVQPHCSLVTSTENSSEHHRNTVHGELGKKENQILPQTPKSLFPQAPVSTSPDDVSETNQNSVAVPNPNHAQAFPEPVTFQETNVPPTLAAASDSGALIQYKVPSPDVSQHNVPFKTTKLTPDHDGGSWGDVLISGGGALRQQKSISSDNSLSYPDVSHAEGDTMEFMAEEDFWVI